METKDLKLSDYQAIFKALADTKRLELLQLLAESPEESSCVCDLTDAFDMAQSKLSYHLKILLDAELITREKKGTWNYYGLNPSMLNHILSEELCCIFRGPAKNSENNCSN
ncbi:arsenical resistance operon repressor [Oceanobacillus picturae]|uniref:Arsenical resistance operon repressor n=1 Tax=Oceanobacillus picturae TaxID=171693 RepID=W9AJ02_9BACI|nr:metalloregulator ArsR/SmtB family transcription factor [Oceanobacillus picturae]RIU89339.1 ArsR family transcriptional regulator [Oceanobacillus picturae]GAQ16324.1 arsenical resistance operon repressor [Oceanobacillus picturae]CDO02626.1 Arsenical resistance operon repressor [Oceanobacillus picturae]